MGLWALVHAMDVERRRPHRIFTGVDPLTSLAAIDEWPAAGRDRFTFDSPFMARADCRPRDERS